MRYYVHYLHFSDYCPHFCRHVYHIVSTVVRPGLLFLLTGVDCSSSKSHVFMDVSYQLSSVNFPSECSSLPSPGIELTHFGYVTVSNQRFYPQNHVSSRTFQTPEEGRSVQRPKRCDKHGDKDEDNSPKNVNNEQNMCIIYNRTLGIII